MVAQIFETPGRIEPCRLEEPGLDIADVIAELAAGASVLGSRLHPRSSAGLADLVRIMNCYYSNLIEGHKTTPLEIERALSNDLDAEEGRRNLQVEAAAHVRVQRGIDAMHAEGRLPDPASSEFIRWLHREFYRDASEEMLLIKGATLGFRMEPGEFRSRPEQDVMVGRHQPPSSERVEAFMRHFESRFRFDRLGGSGGRIMAVAAAHHRLNYIHPFPDGNGRVSRLVSHAMMLKAGMGAHGLWSVSRGLARGLESRAEYKAMMDHADMPRQVSLDGRGNLSERALKDFTLWFLRTCVDQVAFMGGLFDLDNLSARLRRYVESRADFRPEAARILEEVLLRGEMARGDAARVSGLKERSARDLLSGLVEDGILSSETPKSPVFLRFPSHAVEVIFPRLFHADA